MPATQPPDIRRAPHKGHQIPETEAGAGRVLEYSDISTSSLSEPILYFLQKLMLKVDPGSSSPHQWAYLHSRYESVFHSPESWVKPTSS